MLHWTALVTVLAVLFYFYTGFRVPAARRKFGVLLPATTGNANFERILRVQQNTLEWMPIFLPLLWLAAYYVGDRSAAVAGLVWIVGRVMYMVGYTEAVEKRGLGFGIQAVACVALLIGALAGIVGNIVHG
jgi:glutathione S-transferase